ncbi:MAG: transporter permease [Herbinix sp.]|nr:transporter permease [Herbinix sp.]
MGFYLYKARLKSLIRNKENMFWCYMFPILLATCFSFAFSYIGKAESYSTIKIAYDNEGAVTDPLQEAMETASFSEKVPMFSITYCNKEEAETLLIDKKIDGYIVGSMEPVLHVKENGLNETIIKAFLDNYRQITVTVQKVLELNPKAIQEGLLDDVMEHKSYVFEEKDQKNPDPILIYFYSLIAFTCIFAANWGLDEVIGIQADQSTCGARINVSPVRKMKLFLINITAAFTVHCGSLVVLFSYLNFILHVEFANSTLGVFITCFFGSVAGLSLGATVGVWLKQKREVKDSILTAIVLGGSCLSGLMISNVKYIISTYVPILGYINPVNLITDALYSLYYYDTYRRFALNISLLILISIIFIVLSYLGIRRKNYASI